MQPPSIRDRAIEAALRLAARQLNRGAGGGWNLQVANGAITALHARVVDEDWLVWTAPYAGGGQATEAWPLLRVNAGLTGAARLTLASSAAVEVRAEMFIGDRGQEADSLDADFVQRVVALCDDVVAASHDAADLGLEARTSTEPDIQDVERTDQLSQLCAEAGWRPVTQSSGAVQVSLETRAASFQASLTLTATSGLRAFVPLTPKPVAPGVCQNAVALLLLDVGVRVPTVKGITVPHGALEGAGLTVGERRLIDASSLDRTLAALSVACDAVGQEVLALQDTGVARDYLALRQAHPSRSRSTPVHSPRMEDSSCLQLP